MYPSCFRRVLWFALSLCLISCQSRPAGQIRIGSRHLQQYVWIPSGSFTMGCSVDDSQCDPVEGLARAMVIAKGFWMGQTEVTVRAYQRFIQATGRSMPPEPKWQNHLLNPGWKEVEQPIVNVTWDEAQAFCTWAGGRLPTESEWEYASRAGSTSARYGAIDTVAWYSNNSGDTPFDGEAILRSNPNDYGTLLYQSGAHPHAVHQKAPNRWGLYDTLGNVWEWTDSLFGKGGQKPTQVKGWSAPDLQTQVLRGGAWSFAARLSRVSAQGSAPRLHRSTSIGFRCLLERS